MKKNQCLPGNSQCLTVSDLIFSSKTSRAPNSVFSKGVILFELLPITNKNMHIFSVQKYSPPIINKISFNMNTLTWIVQNSFLRLI